jgi:hypothetical protein
MPPTTALWTIDELGAALAVTLSVDYDGPLNSRVREVPDRRTIRYYTTLGLLDRPAEMRGRTALYGRRHLMQLVAIKRLHARGLSLAEVQQRLYGITNAALARLARLPDRELPARTTPASANSVADRRVDAFWAAAPSDLPVPRAEPSGNGSPSLPLQGIPLDDEVLLLLTSSRNIDEDDLPAIRAAAAPLLKLLHTRRLLRPRQERGTP